MQIHHIILGNILKAIKDKWKTDEHYLEWCYKCLELCLKKLTHNGSFYVMTSTQLIEVEEEYIKIGLRRLSLQN